jgi:hypothetical protein
VSFSPTFSMSKRMSTDRKNFGEHDNDSHPIVVALIKTLSDRRPHTAVELAGQLGVHSRTVRRWIHYMRTEMKLPIHAGRHGFCVEPSARNLPLDGAA